MESLYRPYLNTTDHKGNCYSVIDSVKLHLTILDNLIIRDS